MKRLSYKFALLPFITILIAGCMTMQSRWEAAKSEDTIEAYERFLAQHPQGGLAAQAQSRIQILSFQQAVQSNTLEHYEQFVRRYPEGPLTQKARLFIERLHFRSARDTNTIDGYTEFVIQHPQGEFSDSAHILLEGLNNQLKRVTTIRLFVAKADYVSPLLYDLAEQMLETAGYDVVRESNHFDATLTIIATGKPLGVDYSIWKSGITIIPDRGGWDNLPQRSTVITIDTSYSGGYKYTGAEISGVISIFLDSGSSQCTSQFHYELPPPSSFSPQYDFEYSKPEDAPFDSAIMRSNFLESLSNMLSRVGGPDKGISSLLGGLFYLYHSDPAKYDSEIKERLPLLHNLTISLVIESLRNPNWYFKMGAFTALQSFHDSDVLPLLIDALRDSSSDFRTNVSEALSRISGVDLEPDRDKWLEWYNHTILKK